MILFVGQEPNPDRRRARWVFPAVLAGSGAIFFMAGWLTGPGQEKTYLQLQFASDSVHRFAVLALPVSAVVYLFFWPIGRVFVEFDWVRRVTRSIMMAALACFCATGAYILRFDSAIEQKGLAGQFIAADTDFAAPRSDYRPQGPFREDDSGPGVASGELPGGDYLTLDRRTLARRTPDDGYRWSRKRPGRWPASLVVTADTVLLAMPGADFEDDVLLCAVELASGRLRFAFHCLGNSISPVVTQGKLLAFTIRRPSLSAVYLFDWARPRLLWQRELEQPTRLAPRFRGSALEVAQGAEVLGLDLHHGRRRGLVAACEKPDANAVVCRAGRVVGWASDTGKRE